MQIVKFTVNCPRDYGTIRKMALMVYKHEDGTYMPMPCNGCDFSNASSSCIRCMKDIFEKSLKDPTMQSYKQPITP